METINHQRKKNWHQMPNVMHEHRRQYSSLDSSIKQTVQFAENKRNNFIVDWQLNSLR